MGESLTILLKSHPHEFHRVVDFNPETDKLLLLDFTEKNAELSGDVLSDTEKFIEYINSSLKKTGALYGIGGYAENRTVYSRSKLFDNDHHFSGTPKGTEPRRLHLGMDIWGKPHTHVMAPLDGIVHSFAFNNHFGDYGVTIILSHRLAGTSFYTLYGHLSLDDIKNLQEGNLVKKGDVFAQFGIPVENGHWPPHLHFQIIADLQGWKGDYPGVCALSEKEKYLSNCPDPDLILQMNRFVGK